MKEKIHSLQHGRAGGGGFNGKEAPTEEAPSHNRERRLREVPAKKGLIAALLSSLAAAAFAIVLPANSHAVPYVPSFSELLPAHNRAAELLRKNEFDKVIEMENGVLKKNPRDLAAYLMLTIAYLGKGDEKTAVEKAEQAVKADRNYAADVYSGIGRFYMTKKRYHKALVYFRNSLEFREDPPVLGSIASIYLNQGLLRNAKACYEKLLRSRPDYTNLSRIYLAEANYESAITFAQKAVRADLKASGGYLVLGTGYILTGRPELAKATFAVLKDLNPEFFLTDYFLGLISIMQKNYAEALEHFQNVALISPRLKEAYLHMSVIHHVTGELEKAGAEASRAIELDPLDPVPHVALGNILISQRKPDKAELEYQKASELFPDIALPGFKAAPLFAADDTVQPAYMTLTLLHMRSGLYREAVKAAERAAGGSSLENPLYLITRARAASRAGDAKEAEELYHGVMKKLPGMITPLIELAELSASKGDGRGAITLYSRAIGRSPGNSRLMMRLAELYAKSNDAKSAIAEYRKVIASSPDSVSGYKRLSMAILEAGGDGAEALKYALKGASVNPEDMEMKDILGWAYYRIGMYGEALKAYNDVIGNGAGNPLVYYHMGHVKRKLKDVRGAAESFEKALDINDEFSRSAEAKEMLRKLTGLG